MEDAGPAAVSPGDVVTRAIRANVHLNRALSKLGILTRSQATRRDPRRSRLRERTRRPRPAARVDPGRARIAVDGNPRRRAPWRTIAFSQAARRRHDAARSRGTADHLRRHRRGRGRVSLPSGRLDLATSGLLLLTSDTELAAWMTDPANEVPRVYIVTVRGRIADADALAALERGIADGGETLKAASRAASQGVGARIAPDRRAARRQEPRGAAAVRDARPRGDAAEARAASADSSWVMLAPGKCRRELTRRSCTERCRSSEGR